MSFALNIGKNSKPENLGFLRGPNPSFGFGKRPGSGKPGFISVA